MIHHNNCPLCKGTEIKSYLTCTDWLVSREEFQLARCISCDFIFTRQYPEESDAGKYYESDAYLSHTDSGKTMLEKVYRGVRTIMLSRKKNLVIKSCKLKTGSILDIGSGTGYFLDTMKRAGWMAKGIEINRKAREFAISNFGINVIHPESMAQLPHKTFDCISLWHVLEHLYDPDRYFTIISRLLKPGGKVFVALPNSGSLDADHYGKQWAAWDVPRHIWHFNPSTFSLFTSFAGFKITGMAALPFDVFYISVLSEKNRGSFMPVLPGMIKGFAFSVSSAFSPKRSSSLVYILESAGD